MADTLWRATQRNQRPRHHPYAWVEGLGEDRDTPGGHVIVHWGKKDNAWPLGLRPRVLRSVVLALMGSSSPCDTPPVVYLSVADNSNHPKTG